jgi:hypothetical protein
MFKSLNYLKNNWQFVLFVFIGLAWAISFYHSVPNEDEAVIAGHSYFFNKLGYVKSDLYGGYGCDWETRQYFYHKFFVLAGSFVSWLFGFNIYSLKAISALFAIVLFFYIYRYIKDFYPGYNTRNFFLLSAIILLWNNLFFRHSFMYRPEIMVATLGFVSYYYLQKGLHTNKNLYYIISGSFAGLSVFAHLNGLIFCIAGGVFLLLKKKIKQAVVFSIFGIAFSLLYFFDIHSIEEFNKLHLQLTTDPNVLDKKNPFISLLEEHMRFFWSIKEISLSLIFFVPLIFSFKKIKNTNLDLLIYSGLLIISLGMLAHGKTTKYAINYYPFMALVIANFMLNLRGHSVKLQYGFVFLFIFYFIAQGFFNIGYFKERIDINKRTKYISSLMPEKNAKVSAPSVFAFNEIANYTIRGEIAFDHHYSAFKPTEKKTIKKYFQFATEHGDKYIIIDKLLNTRRFILNSEIDTLKINDCFNEYRLKIKQDNIFIFQKMADSKN